MEIRDGGRWNECRKTKLEWNCNEHVREEERKSREQRGM